MRRAAIGALAGSLAFAASMWLFAPSAGRAVDVAGSYLFPHRYAIDVRPGSIKVREGEPVTVVARIPGIDGGPGADAHRRPRRRRAIGAHDAGRVARRVHDHAEQHHRVVPVLR